MSPCGPETNYIRCDDVPVVFTHLLDQEGDVIENINTYAVTKPCKVSPIINLDDDLKNIIGQDVHTQGDLSESLEVETATERLSYGGTGKILTVPFQPDKLYMLPDSGRVYHTGPEHLGAVGLVKSSLAIELSHFFLYDGAKESEPPIAFKWRGRRYKLDNSVLISKQNKIQTK